MKKLIIVLLPLLSACAHQWKNPCKENFESASCLSFKKAMVLYSPQNDKERKRLLTLACFDGNQRACVRLSQKDHRIISFLCTQGNDAACSIMKEENLYKKPGTYRLLGRIIIPKGFIKQVTQDSIKKNEAKLCHSQNAQNCLTAARSWRDLAKNKKSGCEPIGDQKIKKHCEKLFTKEFAKNMADVMSEKACQLGSVKSCEYTADRILKKDRKSALKLYAQICRAGNAKACDFELTLKCEQDDANACGLLNCNSNQRAFYALKKGCEKGLKKACISFSDRCIPKNEEQMKEFLAALKVGCSKNSATACLKLGEVLLGKDTSQHEYCIRNSVDGKAYCSRYGALDPNESKKEAVDYLKKSCYLTKNSRVPYSCPSFIENYEKLENKDLAKIYTYNKDLCGFGVVQSCDTLFANYVVPWDELRKIAHRHIRMRDYLSTNWIKTIWDQEKCEAGCTKSCSRLDEFVISGRYRSYNSAKVMYPHLVRTLSSLCTKGRIESCFALAILFVNGKKGEFDADWKKAIEFAHKGCSLKDTKSCVLEKKIIEKSRCLKPTSSLFASCYQMAYSSLEFRGENKARNIDLRILDNLCHQKYRDACDLLVHYYRKIELNLESALKYRNLFKAAGGGKLGYDNDIDRYDLQTQLCFKDNAEACFDLANFYLGSYSTFNMNPSADSYEKKWVPKAYALYQKSCKLGHSTACYHAALIEIYGVYDKTLKNIDRGINRLKKLSTQKGYQNIYFLLATYYLKGKRVPRDLKQVRSYLVKGCDANDKSSCETLAKGLSEGVFGFKKDAKRSAEVSVKAEKIKDRSKVELPERL